MKLGIMQPYFLPYIGYWQLINAVDKYVIYDDVQFIKGGWINRNNTLINGNKFMINLLLSGASPNKFINEIRVQENQNKLIKTVEFAYKKAPLFNNVFPLFLEIMEYPDKNLGKFLGNSIVQIVKYLAIDTEIIYSSEIKKDNTLRAQDKVIHICEILCIDKYYNAFGGIEMYSKKDFSDNNIELSFLETKMNPYKQFDHEFIPNLSILDILMFNSNENIKSMLVNFKLL